VLRLLLEVFNAQYQYHLYGVPRNPFSSGLFTTEIDITTNFYQ